VKLEYYDGITWVVIASGQDNDGSYDWTVPSLNINNAKVRISVSDFAGNIGSDESDAAFIIDSTHPAINIASAKQSGQELLISLGSTINAVQGVVNIQVTASDALSGLAGPRPLQSLLQAVRQRAPLMSMSHRQAPLITPGLLLRAQTTALQQ